MIDERIELLINRRLDGALSEPESLELDKLLIRDPTARALMEEYARMDTQAGEAIRAVAAVPEAMIEADQVTAWTSARPHWWQSFGLVTAVAAAITLAVLLSQRAAVLQDHDLAVSPIARQSPGPGPQAENLWTVGEQAASEPVNVERDVIGIWDRQSRSLYLLEADRPASPIEPANFSY